MVHGDDFLLSGRRSELEWAITEFEWEYACKVDLIGRSEDLPRATRFFNRVMSFDSKGCHS